MEKWTPQHGDAYLEGDQLSLERQGDMRCHGGSTAVDGNPLPAVCWDSWFKLVAQLLPVTCLNKLKNETRNYGWSATLVTEIKEASKDHKSFRERLVDVVLKT